MGKTKIEWAGSSWNPIRARNRETGGVGHFCTHASEGCRFCYAERLQPRFQNPIRYAQQDLGKVEIFLDKQRLHEPLGWRKSRVIFVNSMTDTFLEHFETSWIDSIAAIAALCPQHEFLILTKRAERMRGWANDAQTPYRVLKAIDAIQVDLAMKGVAELFLPVAGFEGLYEVSNYGRVRSRGRTILAPALTRGGYYKVSFSKDGVVTQHRVSKLVNTAFGPPPKEGEETRHRNGNVTDNRSANLLWGTRTENMADASRHGTAGRWMKGQADFSPEEIREIRRRRGQGEKLDAIAEDFGSSRQQISAICLGQTYRPADLEWPLPNVWMGVSAENQPTAKARLAELEHVPAAIRFVSLEPLIESVDLNMLGCDPIKWLDWVIVGGESGPKSRPMHPQWARWIRDTCAEYDVPFFFKQHGDWRHALNWGHFLGHRRGVLLHIDGTPVDGDPDMMWDDRTVAKMIRLGKKTAGRKLDGVEYNEMPG